MEIGSGIAIAGGCFSIVMIIYRIFPLKEQTPLQVNQRCSDHAMIAQEIINVKEWLKTIEGKLDKVLNKL